MENCSSHASREIAQQTRERLARERGYNLTARTTSASTTATIAVQADDRTEVETTNPDSPATNSSLQSSDVEEEGAGSTAVGSTEDDDADIDNADASSTIASADDDVAR